MNFEFIERRKTGDKEGKVRGVVVLHTEVIHHQDKGDRAGGVAEKTGGVGLVELESLEERNKTEVRQLTCLLCPVLKRGGGKGETKLGERRC